MNTARRVWLLAALWLGCCPAQAASTVVIVEGLGGEPRYATEFADQVAALSAAARTLSPEPALRVFAAEEASREEILAYFAELAESVQGNDQLIVYLVGHGSYDDQEYKFNIAGPDLTAEDILGAMRGIPSVNQLLVNTSSASGAGAELWADERRVVITATRSGVERHATRFGIRFAAALANDSADLDKNRIVTAQEAFDYAARAVADFYESAGQLATEHPKLSGDRAARISLARLGTQRQDSGDARLRELNSLRDDINGRIEALRLRRDGMPAADYQQELLEVMLELAEAEEAIEQRQQSLDDSGDAN